MIQKQAIVLRLPKLNVVKALGMGGVGKERPEEGQCKSLERKGNRSHMGP